MLEANLLIAGGEVVTAEGLRRVDVACRGEQIVAVGSDLEVAADCVVLDAGGCWIGPGLVDIHTHLRQPGAEDAETIVTGARAAALGGYSAVVAMPNTDPPADCAEVVRAVLEIPRSACVEVAVAGTITLGRRGDQLAPLAELAAAGVRVCTDDGSGVQDAGLMRRALEYAKPLGLVLAEHCEDRSLSAKGVAHEGYWSSRLGLAGWPAEAEEAMVARDLLLASATGGRLHLMHLSTAGSLKLLENARSQGVAVTAEVTPHHLSLTDAELAGFDPVYRVNPPLRSADDVEELGRALLEGAIDVVATDHAPHTAQSKEFAFAEAPPGMIGLETAVAVVRTQLPEMGPELLFEVFSTRPAAICGLELRHGGPVGAGRAANLCVFDPSCKWVVDPALGASLSRNTPFAGRELVGKVRHTVVGGVAMVIDAEAQR